MVPPSYKRNMSEVPTIKIVVRKKQLLEDVGDLNGLVAEYSEILRRVEIDESWEDDAIALLRSHHRILNNSKIGLRVIDLVSVIMRELLEKLNVDEFSIKLGPDGQFLGDISRGASPAGSPDEVTEQLDNLIERVNSIAVNAPLAMQEKIRYLLLSTRELMKFSLSGDRNGVQDCMTQINLLTSTKESQALVREIAIIARDIYNTLNTLSDGIPVIDTLTESTEGISDAARKLKAVVAKLEEAAFNNLDHLELLTNNVKGDEEICERILEGLRKCQHILGELKSTHPDKAGEFAALQDKLGDQIGGGVMMLRSRLHDNGETYLALTANQGFQDLTGQTLKKTIHFIESLEFQLVEVLKKYKPLLGVGAGDVVAAKSESGEEQEEQAEDSGIRQNQEDVDQLLADLGF